MNPAQRRLHQPEGPRRLPPVVQLGEAGAARAQIRQVVGPGVTELVARPRTARQEPAARLQTEEAFRLNDPAVGARHAAPHVGRAEEHTSELQSQSNLVCRLLLEKKKTDDTRPG